MHIREIRKGTERRQKGMRNARVTYRTFLKITVSFIFQAKFKQSTFGKYET